MSPFFTQYCQLGLFTLKPNKAGKKTKRDVSQQSVNIQRLYLARLRNVNAPSTPVLLWKQRRGVEELLLDVHIRTTRQVQAKVLSIAFLFLF